MRKLFSPKEKIVKSLKTKTGNISYNQSKGEPMVLLIALLSSFETVFSKHQKTKKCFCRFLLTHLTQIKYVIGSKKNPFTEIWLRMLKKI